MIDIVDVVARPVISLGRDPGSFAMPAPKYVQLADTIRAQIRAGQLKPGEQLPSTNDFKAAGHTYGTIRSALLVLKAEGWVEGRQGDGVYVTDNPPT
jgi:GntR family transcriptional regulator